MSSSKREIAAEHHNRGLARVLSFGLIGAMFLGLVGGVEGVIAFYAFRAIDLFLFPNYGAFVMTAVSSQLPIVLTVVGLLGGAIGIACFGAGRRAQDDAKATLQTILRNSFCGTMSGVFVGGMSGLALGRIQSQEPITLFATFFAGVFFGFLLGLILSLIFSIKRKSKVV